MVGLNKQKFNIPKETENILATISHDLKNPLSSVLLALKLLNNPIDSPLNDFQKEILDNVTNSIKYMQNLVINILDKYRFDNNKYEINKNRINFLDFVNNIIQSSKYILLDKNQTVKFSTNVNEPFIEIDVLEMRRVIDNLILNSSKYSPQNSTIVIEIFEENNSICFSIENTCYENTNDTDVFERFVLSNENAHSIATGLGLFIVREIIAAHNGQIVINKENNLVKTTFSIPKN